MMSKTVDPRSPCGPRLMGSGEEGSPTKVASRGAQLLEVVDNSMNGASEGTEAIVESAEKVTVAVRLRPLSAAEKKGSHGQAVSIIDRCVTVKDDFNSRSYKYDYCFDSSGGDDAAGAGATQEDVFYALGNRVLAHAWGGFNSTIFAYGQTGSGKTYTMMGEEGEDEGLVPRIARALLSEIKKAETEPNQSADRFSVKVSYIEIYNERVYDLLANLPELSKSLKIRENAKSGVYVDGAMTKEVGSWEEMRDVLEQGQSARRVARTNMNVESSRSHAIFTLEFRQTGVKKTDNNTAANASSTVDRVSRLCLVDLAGSERADKTGMSSDRLRETASINKSLLTLSCVINALAQEEKENHSNATPHIPYRDSALTFLLRDSLGGNSKTIMLATVSPSHVHTEESLNTLRYADRAKSIMTHARVNENPKDRRIRNLEEELAMLKRQLEETKKGSNTPVEGLPVAMTDDDRDALEQRHQMEMSTLRLQNFARATLLKKAKALGHRPTGLSEPSSPRSVSSSSSRPRDASELPHLTRLSEGDSLEGEQIFRLCSEITHFDSEGCIVGPHSTRNVAFTINYSSQGRMYVTVPASCQLYVNGTLVSFCNSRESTNVDIWDGTRIATGLDRIFLVLLASADAEPPLSPVSASMYALHKAVWMVLQPHHSLYLRAAQAEIRRGCQLQPEHVETLIRTGNIVDAPLKHSPSGWTEVKPPAASPPPRLVDDMRIPHTSSPAECSNLTVSEDESQSVNTAASLNNPVSGRSSVAASEGEKEHSNDRALSVATLSSNRHSGALCRPCEPAVSKLPRLAKRSNKPFASLAAAPALPAPAGSSLAPTVMPASIPLPPPPVVMPPPPPPSTSTTSSPPLSSLGIGSVVRRKPSESLAERPATRESISSKKTNLAYNNDVNAGAIVIVTKTAHLPAAPVVFEEGAITLTVPNVQDALKVVRPRFLRLAAALRERVFADFRREEFTDQLVLKVVMQIPLVAEANALAYTLDKPVTYFLDVSPRPAQPMVADTRELLQDIKQSSFTDALGLDMDNALPPSQLELAAQNHIVVVRARDSLTGHETEMSVDDLRQRVLSFRAYKARALSKLYTNGTQSPLHPEPDDPFLVTTEEKIIARADISVSPLLEGKNVIGEFPILHPLNGLCIGAVKARLICDGVTPQDVSEGYNLRFDLEEVKIEKAAFKGGKAASLARVLGLREQDEQLVMRWCFLNKDLSGEIPLSERSSTVRDLVSRAPEQGPHWKYPMNFSRTFNVQHVEVPFLSYLATGALKLTLVVHPDPTLRDASQGKQGARHHEGDRLAALRLAMNIEPPAHESKALVLHSQSRMGYGADDELKSEYGSDLGGADSVSRLSLRSATGLRPPSMTMRKSMKRSSVRSHVPSLRLSSAASAHAGVNNTTPSSILVFMAVDMMEPEIDLSRPDRPYPHQGEPRYLPVDVKRACLRMNTSTSTMASTLTGIQEVDEMDDEMSRASEPWSELDSCLTGMPTACAAEPVFRVTGTPLIPARQIRIVLEQIEPLPAFQLESCVRVKASSYVALTSQQYTGDITEHTECEINLHIMSVNRSAAKRRLDIYAELPAAPILWENKHGKGDRVVVIIDVSVFLEGVVRPVTLRRNLIMKAVPPARKTSMFYNIRKSLRESTPTIDRLYQLGSYYAVRNVPPSYLTEAVADFIAFKLRAQENLWQRLDTAREYQEGAASLLKTDGSSGSNKKLPQQIDQSLDSWKHVLNSPRDSDASTPSAAGASKAAGPGNAAAAADEAYMGQVVEFMHPPTAAVPKAKERQQICAAVFGIDASLRRRASLRMDGDGVYRVSEDLGEDKPVFTYSYAIRPRLPMTAQRSGAGASADDWKAVTDVEVRELADYPIGREGYLSMRTGLLGVSLSRYWFVFRRPFLVRYNNKDQNTPAAILNVTDCKISRGSDEFEIVVRGGPSKTWVLQAANGTDLMEWMYALDPVSYDTNMATVWRNF